MRCVLDGNQAAAHVAHKTNEVIAIYPITPSSPMGEQADEWSSQGRTNLWGAVPTVIEMQSEGGAAGTVHGALQRGALTTTFTASQGLLLMIPNMYKIAGELTSTVFHVAARSVAAQALSIFCDHSDVMATRATGFAMLASNSVQEVMDLALIAQAATLQARIPVLHFFDGFRTSHELCKIDALQDETLRAMIQDASVRAHRGRGLSPDRPVVRGTAQNPDVFFQARETVNPYYERMPDIVEEAMSRFADLTGRRYHLFDYAGAEDADRVIVLMGSAAEAAHETVDHLLKGGERVGVLKVHLYRPLSPTHLIAALPRTVRRIAVLDRCKEPGADGEPLYKDVLSVIAQHVLSGGTHFAELPRVIGGRYGLSSKEFTPAMVKAVFEELAKPAPKNGFTVGIVDDVTHSSLEWDPSFQTDADAHTIRAVFYGLGSDGTVSANKSSIKIIGEETELYAQGHFVYDSRKAGAVTVSHLRFGPNPIRAPYLVGDGQAQFVGCHQAVFLDRYDMLSLAAPGATFLLNSPAAPDRVWDTLPRGVQQQIIDKRLRLYAIDAYQVAKDAGLGRRINTVMQTCFFSLSGVLAPDEAIGRIKHAVERTYGRKGRGITSRNFRAIEASLASLHEVRVPDAVTSERRSRPAVPEDAPDFVQRVTGEMLAGRGDQIPVSALPADGSYPVGTAAYEKRRLALEVPVWEQDLCIQCGKCVFVCPHSVIRSKVIEAERLADAPADIKHMPTRGTEFGPGLAVIYQACPEDCTGCGLCVDICPVRDKTEAKRKALNMRPISEVLQSEQRRWSHFERLAEYDRTKIRWTTLKGAMLAQPLFEFSGACVGCGETPYIRLATQLFGDRMIIANATGCSSIYGGNLPTTPYAKNAEGRGPAWSNSLFEDNAEFGLGFRVALDEQAAHAAHLLRVLREQVGPELADAIINADQSDEPGIFEQRKRVAELLQRLASLELPEARNLENLADALTKKSVWLIGGDGWAYDIGFGGLDHALASARDINILVLDTEVYSNTGGQMSKATPRGAVAKFAAGGKPTPKKDLAMIAIAHEHVYVAHVAFGAKDLQTLRAFREAESYAGPSLIIAYSPCIAHGVDLSRNLLQQRLAVQSGHWPLFRYDPRRTEAGDNPLQLDSPKPSIPYKAFAETEMRFGILQRTQPAASNELLARAQQDVDERYRHYEQLAALDYQKEPPVVASTQSEAE